MSPAEMDAVLVSEVSAVESRLYVYLRRHMDYRTGIVGHPRRISYQSIREHIEHVPERGSTVKPFSPSNQQVNRLLRKLESRGFIERLHDGSQLKEAMLFRMLLATTDLNRPDEERQRSDTRAPTRQTSVSTGASSVMSDKGATREERHTSVPSDIKPLSIAHAREASEISSSPTGQELTFNQQFRQIANITGLTYNDEQLEGLFEAFRFTKKNRNLTQGITDWLADWRVWCGREKAYGKPTKTNSGAGGNQRPENPTARLLRKSKAEQAELARTGYYEQGNQSGDDPQF